MNNKFSYHYCASDKNGHYPKTLSFVLSLFTFLIGLCLAEMVGASISHAGCAKKYKAKIKDKKEKSSGMNEFFFPVARYEKVLTLLEDVQKGKESDAITQFLSDVAGPLEEANRGLSSYEEFITLLKELDNHNILCNPDPVPYPSLVKNFLAYLDLLDAKKKEDWIKIPFSDRKKLMQETTVQRLEKAFKENQGCSPYKNDLNFVVRPLVKLSVDSVSVLPPVGQKGNQKGIVKRPAPEENCAICMENFPAEEVFSPQLCSCEGKRSACKDCLKTTLKTDFEDIEKGHPNNCPLCMKPMKVQEWYKAGIITAEQVLDWKMAELLEASKNCPNFIACDTHDCQNGFFKNEAGFKQYAEKGCPTCGKQNPKCLKCFREAHPGISCEKAHLARLKECELNGFSECPNCRMTIMHDGACFHMTCPECKMEYSDITKLPKNPKTDDVGGWPKKYFYKGGVRVDQNDHPIDPYGNLIQEVKRPVNVDGKVVWIPQETIVGRDGKSYFEYFPSENKAFRLNPKTFKREAEVPKEKFHLFKGEWKKIVTKIMNDRAKELELAEKQNQKKN